jgi:hypothetical protein
MFLRAWNTHMISPVIWVSCHGILLRIFSQVAAWIRHEHESWFLKSLTLSPTIFMTHSETSSIFIQSSGCVGVPYLHCLHETEVQHSAFKTQSTIYKIYYTATELHSPSPATQNLTWHYHGLLHHSITHPSHTWLSGTIYIGQSAPLYRWVKSSIPLTIPLTIANTSPQKFAEVSPFTVNYPV